MEIQGFKNRQVKSQNTPLQLQPHSNNLVNNSGQGSDSPVLDIISNKFNWGAFFLHWIWGLGNRTYITLLVFPAAFIPFVGMFAYFGLCIWFGIKGNTWAWQNKKWPSIEYFQSVQKKWAIAGITIAVLGTIFAIACFSFFVSLFSYSGMHH